MQCSLATDSIIKQATRKVTRQNIFTMNIVPPPSRPASELLFLEPCRNSPSPQLVEPREGNQQ
jgi:hypothetical protein